MYFRTERKNTALHSFDSLYSKQVYPQNLSLHIFKNKKEANASFKLCPTCLFKLQPQTIFDWRSFVPKVGNDRVEILQRHNPSALVFGCGLTVCLCPNREVVCKPCVAFPEESTVRNYICMPVLEEALAYSA